MFSRQQSKVARPQVREPPETTHTDSISCRALPLIIRLTHRSRIRIRTRPTCKAPNCNAGAKARPWSFAKILGATGKDRKGDRLRLGLPSDSGCEADNPAGETGRGPKISSAPPAQRCVPTRPRQSHRRLIVSTLWFQRLGTCPARSFAVTPVLTFLIEAIKKTKLHH